MTAVTIIDYGAGNLMSVTAAVEYCGAQCIMSNNSKEIECADRVILPGVGAFGDCMNDMKKRGLDEAVRVFSETGRPLLGICIGMQMLMDESEEFGRHKGLGLIPGPVVAIPATGADGITRRLPHVGWSELVLATTNSWDGTLLQDTKPGAWVYFVHSFTANPQNVSHRLADCEYGGQRLSAVVARDNITGCQFHPEKSGEVGLGIIRRFLRA